MKYLFDENTSVHMVHLMQHLDADVYHVTEVYHSGIQDEDYLPDLRNKDFVLVTTDKKMRGYTGKHGHGLLLAEVKARVLFLPSAFQSGALGVQTAPNIPWSQCAWLFNYWPRIDDQVCKMPNLALARITDRGKVIPI